MPRLLYCLSWCSSTGDSLEPINATVVTPAEAGVHLRKMDSRLRGNDMSFAGIGEESRHSCKFELQRSFAQFTLSEANGLRMTTYGLRITDPQLTTDN